MVGVCRDDDSKTTGQGLMSHFTAAFLIMSDQLKKGSTQVNLLTDELLLQSGFLKCTTINHLSNTSYMSLKATNHQDICACRSYM